MYLFAEVAIHIYIYRLARVKLGYLQRDRDVPIGPSDRADRGPCKQVDRPHVKRLTGPM